MIEPFLLWHSLTWLLFLVGLLGALLPLPWLPGLPLIWAGVWLYGWATEFSGFGAAFLIWQAALVLIGQALDYVASVFGTKRFGGSRAGAWGAFLGGLFGMLFLPLGLIVGPFVGALIGELLVGRDVLVAFRSGWGSVVGMCGGVVFKFVLGLTMIGLFIWQAY